MSKKLEKVLFKVINRTVPEGSYIEKEWPKIPVHFDQNTVN